MDAGAKRTRPLLSSRRLENAGRAPFEFACLRPRLRMSCQERFQWRTEKRKGSRCLWRVDGEDRHRLRSWPLPPDRRSSPRVPLQRLTRRITARSKAVSYQTWNTEIVKVATLIWRVEGSAFRVTIS